MTPDEIDTLVSQVKNNPSLISEMDYLPSEVVTTAMHADPETLIRLPKVFVTDEIVYKLMFLKDDVSIILHAPHHAINELSLGILRAEIERSGKDFFDKLDTDLVLRSPLSVKRVLVGNGYFCENLITLKDEEERIALKIISHPDFVYDNISWKTLNECSRDVQLQFAQKGYFTEEFLSYGDEELAEIASQNVGLNMGNT